MPISRFVIMVLLVALFVSPASAADDDNSTWTPEDGVKKFGVVHNIAQDREVERIGGIYEPEGLDKYIQRKTEELSAQIQSVQNDVQELKKQMTEILELLKSKASSDFSPSQGGLVR